MKQDAYSPHKAAHYHRELTLFREGKPLEVAPRQVQIDPFNPCNHDCPFCVYRFHADEDVNALFKESDVISAEKMEEIFDSCVEMGVRGVELTGGGEPTAHPMTLAILSAALSRGLEVGLITNGASPLWKQGWELPRLVGQCAWIRFSLDAATALTHRVTHRGQKNDYFHVLRSIERTLSARKEHTIVGISFVVTQDNYREIVDAAQLAKTVGADNIRYSAAIFPGKSDAYHTEHRGMALEFMRRAKEQYEDERFKVFAFGERMEWETSYGNYRKGDFCYYSTLNAVIGADLNLYPCCVMKYRPQGVIASLKEQSFKAAWESEARREYYRKLDISESCKTCYLKPKNDFINYLVQPEPLHINFI